MRVLRIKNVNFNYKNRIIIKNFYKFIPFIHQCLKNNSLYLILIPARFKSKDQMLEEKR